VEPAPLLFLSRLPPLSPFSFLLPLSHPNIMSLHSTTLPSQPPPLHARSPYDVASFDSLTNSLRQHPDLTGESDKILNSFQLAKFVDGVRRFQDGNLGMVRCFHCCSFSCCCCCCCFLLLLLVYKEIVNSFFMM
jgi:hypothetical protein